MELRYALLRRRSNRSKKTQMGIMSLTWLQTARRLLPHLGRLSREIRPTIHLSSASDLRSEQLREQGIKAILWDVDGTLMAHHADRVDPAVADVFDALLAAPDLQHAIVSNCQETRFFQLARIFPGVPIVFGYETSLGPAFRVQRGMDTSWRGPGAGRDQTGAQKLSPIRKPSARLVEAALAELNMSSEPEAVMLVGDQYFTDIVSANLAGIRSVKVPTLKQASFPIPVKLSQRLEAVLYRLKHGWPKIGWPAHNCVRDHPNCRSHRVKEPDFT